MKAINITSPTNSTRKGRGVGKPKLGEDSPKKN